MLTENVAPLEAIWTAVAIVGVAVGVALALHIWLSYRAVVAWIDQDRLVRWGPRHKFVVGFLIGVLLLLLVWLGFVSLGVNAMLNAPPSTPDRAAASERGGTILLVLETVLLAFQMILTYAWVSVGKPTLHPDRAPHSPVALMFRAIDLGREMGHTVANDLQQPVTFLDDASRDDRLPADVRSDAAMALAYLQQTLGRVRELHATIRALEGTT